MFCPECGTEYRAGFTTCADCQIALVEDAPAEPTFPKMVKVFETSDRALLLVTKGVLQAANIPFSVVGEAAQDLIGLGRLGSGFNVATGPVRIEVPEEDVEEARGLLAPDELQDDEAPPDED